MEKIDLKQIDFKKINIDMFTILSTLFIIAGILFYVGWGVRYNVWLDVGVYSLTILLVLAGVFGLLLSFFRKKED